MVNWFEIKQLPKLSTLQTTDDKQDVQALLRSIPTATPEQRGPSFQKASIQALRPADQSYHCRSVYDCVAKLGH